MNDYDKEDVISQAYQFNHEVSAEVMLELLQHSDAETWIIFDNLARNWLKAGSADVRKGIDIACNVITGCTLDVIAQEVLDRFEEYFGDVIDDDEL